MPALRLMLPRQRGYAATTTVVSRGALVLWSGQDPGRMEEAEGAVYARREGVVLREVAGEHILVPIRRDVADLQAIFALKRVGLRIWELLDGVRSLDGILGELLERFDVAAEEASVDLRSFVERLSAAGLVERRR
jgi:hypothetical protein